MLDELHALIKDDRKIVTFKNILELIAEITEMVSSFYLKDPEKKNEAIDLICNIIESQKTTPKELQ